MDLGLYIAASGMVAEQVREGQLSNDLANAATPGYKSDEAPQHSFGEVLVASTHGAPVGTLDTGVALGKTYTDMTPASIEETGEPLDFAIQGSGFFAVKTAQGVRYSRDGQFTSTAAGVLTDVAGDPVLTQSGATIKVGADGTVPASEIGIFEVPGAAKQGENLYTGTALGQSQRQHPPGGPGGLRRERLDGDDRHGRVAAGVPVRSAGHSGDRPDAAGVRLAGGLAQRRLSTSAQVHPAMADHPGEAVPRAVRLDRRYSPPRGKPGSARNDNDRTG